MAKNTSILLVDYFHKFSRLQIKSALINELKKGEKSGFSANFNRETFKEKLHQKYLAEI